MRSKAAACLADIKKPLEMKIALPEAIPTLFYVPHWQIFSWRHRNC
jgi:hypothetical protein